MDGENVNHFIMKKYVKLLNSNEADGFFIEKTSLKCPYCHKEQISEMYAAIRYKSSKEHFILCECSNSDCQMAFNALYNTISRQFSIIQQSTQIVKEFSDIIKVVSPEFCDIYNEAYAAEQMGLGQITGVGYRKALEFLIKDYLISLDQSHEEDIKKKPLGQCIRYNVTNENIKQVAERATWIGNDETHYVRKWENKDITDLKTLIDLTIYWIEAEIKTKKTLEDMPKRENG